MRQRLLVPEILELLDGGRHEDLAGVLEELHPKDAAAIVSGLDPAQIARVMSILPVTLARDLFIYFEPETQADIVRGAEHAWVRELLAAMASDDRAEFLEEINEPVRELVFPLLTRADRLDLARRHGYEEDQVGAILSTEYCMLEPEMTPVQAIEAIRRQAPSRETIYYSYVIDAEDHLVGFVSLRDLIMAQEAETVGSIMRTDLVSVKAEADREEAVRLIREYDLIAIPVTDDADRLLGIVTHDDAAEVAEEEAEEDIENLAGITGEAEEEAYIDEPVGSHFRRRVIWVALLALTYMITAEIIGVFRSDLASFPVLAMLLPMVLATGGNVGQQASTAVLLGLRGELRPRQFTLVFWKELRISACLAILLGVIAGTVAFLLGRHENPMAFAAAVALAMGAHVVTAASLGSMIPLIVAALGRDPSMVANPALTTFADLSGTVIYFVVVTSLLPIAG